MKRRKKVNQMFKRQKNKNQIKRIKIFYIYFNKEGKLIKVVQFKINQYNKILCLQLIKLQINQI